MRSWGSALVWVALLSVLVPAFAFNVAGVLVFAWLLVLTPGFWAVAGIYAALCFARWVVSGP
jgi:hypothetical protein